MRRLRKVVIFIQTILSFVLSRKIIDIYVVYIYIYKIIVWTVPLPLPRLQMGGMEISKYWIMRGWKNLIINGWVKHNGEVDLKMGWGCNPFRSNFAAIKDTQQNFRLLTQCPQNTQQVHSRTAMVELAQDTFSSTFSCL